MLSRLSVSLSWPEHKYIQPMWLWLKFSPDHLKYFDQTGTSLALIYFCNWILPPKVILWRNEVFQCFMVLWKMNEWWRMNCIPLPFRAKNLATIRCDYRWKQMYISFFPHHLPFLPPIPKTATQDDLIYWIHILSSKAVYGIRFRCHRPVQSSYCRICIMNKCVGKPLLARLVEISAVSLLATHFDGWFAGTELSCKTWVRSSLLRDRPEEREAQEKGAVFCQWS